MSTSLSQLNLLDCIVSSLISVRPPQTSHPSSDRAAFEGMVYGTINPSNGHSVGIPQEASSKVGLLTKSLRRDNPNILRGVSLEVMCEKVVKAIIELFRERIGEQAQPRDLTELKQRIETWFDAVAVTRQHFIPCTILPSRAQAFEIGPIRFLHISDLNPTDFGLPQRDDVRGLLLDPLTRMMQERAAGWIGVVQIEGREEKRSAEIADLAVDVALGGLQLIILADYGRYIARITARTLPPYRGSLAVTDGKVTGGVRNMQPGHGLLAASFETFVNSATTARESIGRRVDAYLSNQVALPSLEQAWCDAVYWFHESLSEPLDTVAVTKLETAIENLFAAGNTTNSKKRALDALSGMFEFEKKDKSLKGFVDNFVEARSRVLHGTWSTLSDYKRDMDRKSLEFVTRQLLLKYPMLLDRYSNSSTAVPQGKSQSFLDWIARNST